MLAEEGKSWWQIPAMIRQNEQRARESIANPIIGQSYESARKSSANPITGQTSQSARNHTADPIIRQASAIIEQVRHIVP